MDSELAKAHGSTMTRGQRGREWARLEFGVAIAAILGAAMMWIAMPVRLDPMVMDGTTGAIFSIGGIVGVVVGLTWMTHIYRAGPEPDHGSWRYRDSD